MSTTVSLRTKATMAKAQTIARGLLARFPRLVLEVWVFGSVARDGIGNDLDMIIVAPSDKAEEWSNEVECKLRMVRPGSVAPAYSYSGARHIAASGALGLGFTQALGNAIDITNVAVDLFVFPPNWREDLEGMQAWLPHEDPNFMQNIAEDAVQIT